VYLLLAVGVTCWREYNIEMDVIEIGIEDANCTQVERDRDLVRSRQGCRISSLAELSCL
jgi:hypothetical protein